MAKTYTTVLLVDGQRAGGQSDATWDQIRALVHDEDGIDGEFLDVLDEHGCAAVLNRYRVLPSDKRDTVSVLVVYTNQ